MCHVKPVRSYVNSCIKATLSVRDYCIRERNGHYSCHGGSKMSIMPTGGYSADTEEYRRRIRNGEDPNQQDGGIGPSPEVVQQQQQPQPQMNREQWRDAWMGAGQMSPEDADKWLSSHGAQQLGEKAGVWRTPSGDVLDLQSGRGGAKATGGKITPGWTQVGGGGYEQSSPMQPSPNGMNQMMNQDQPQEPENNIQNERNYSGMQRNRMSRNTRGGLGPSMQFGNNNARLQNQGYSPS